MQQFTGVNERSKNQNQISSTIAASRDKIKRHVAINSIP